MASVEMDTIPSSEGPQNSQIVAFVGVVSSLWLVSVVPL